MANLTRLKWTRFEPDIGDNLCMPAGERFYLEIARGLTREQLAAFRENVSKSAPIEGLEGDALKRALRDQTEERVAALTPYVRLGKVELSIDGLAIPTINDYLWFFSEQASLYQWIELVRELGRVNSVDGSAELFSARPSGGSSSTAEQSTARGGHKQVAH